MNLRTARIAARTMVAADIVALDLAAADGRPLPEFTAGAHIDLELAAGLVRQYSLRALRSAEGLYRIAVLRDPASRGGSLAVHALAEGAEVRISEPRNHFPLIAGSHHSLLFAGGIGVTPLLCMAEELERSARGFTLHYCARSPAHAAFLGGSMVTHFDNGPSAQRLDIAATLAQAPAGSHIYVCGPGGFIAWILDAAERAGWPSPRVHREYFKSDPAAQGDAGSFQIRLARSGTVFHVPADRSIVSVLRENGVDVPVSCESGVCGTCLTQVVSGAPDHRDFYLTPEEKARGDQILPCCSRASSAELVLDL